MRRVTMKTLYASPERTVQAGATAEFEDAEAEGLVAGGYGVYEGDTRPKPESADKPVDKPLDRMTVEQLRGYADEHDISLPPDGKKADLVAAIEAELQARA
ncbi:hypothetical protein [Streptomyces scabiei]|uniref:hypothetical protein n=1 Tax=Streptomyces scabiei TaxID=1930 RepID=UPI000765BFC3|nr:hypothetical protein [Streptomyces scabiei]